MARTIPESIAGIQLYVPAANDFFSIDATGMPNGDPCLVINSGGVSNPDFRAFAPAPTLSPNIFKVAGQGPFSCTFWAKSTSVAGAGGFAMGVHTAVADSSLNNNQPLRITINTDNNLGVGACSFQYGNGSGGTSVSYTAGGLSFGNIWKFYAIMIGAPGNPGSSYVVESPNVPPIALTAQGNRGAGTNPFSADQYFWIGRYSDGAPASTSGVRTIRLGKISFHDKFLTLTECQMMYDAMLP